jgi:NAD(P)-dependent dehydrogenase (short-subunit alcohol dehydrogenase family)
MHVRDKVVVVTGGASGIGRALCRRFAAEGARGVIVADRDEAAAARVAAEIQGIAVPTDVAIEQQVQHLAESTLERFGQIDLFCCNAGIALDGGIEAPDEDWQRIWNVNLMAHVYAARAVIPGMLARKQGYFLQTASAAGLLSQIGSAPYSVTKHAAVAFAEWLSIRYGDSGIGVSCLCPQGVRTPMLLDSHSGIGAFLLEGALEPEAVAEAVIQGLAAEQFLILPHADVAKYFRHKADDYDRWIRGLRKLQRKVGQ